MSEEAYVRWTNRHLWLDGCDLDTEYRQASEEGRDLSNLEAEFRSLLALPGAAGQTLGGQRDRAWVQACARLIDRVQEQPYRPDFPYNEPSDLESIDRTRPAPITARPWRGDRSQFLEHLHGGLLGRICGCMLGKPVEGWNRESIRITAEETGNWPLSDYLRAPTTDEQSRIAARKPKNALSPALSGMLRDSINGMVEDDDTNYTTVNFAILKQYGADFTPLDVASFWGQNLPIFHTCTAERVAYRNFISGVLPPASASYRNPYREWIGAQIRGDYFGYANPGHPARAAQWAWRDACISHVKNGIYGEMWVAAMLAAAYVENDWPAVIRAGLGHIPASCRLAQDVATILDAHRRGLSYDEIINRIHRRWDESIPHHWCHTISNAQIVAAALLWGEDDYEKTICRAVMAGFDTDCNGATAGSLWGVMHGVSSIPAKWTVPIKDKLRTGVDGYHEVHISALAEEMAEIAARVTPR